MRFLTPAWRDREQGSVAIEAAIIGPALLVLFVLIIAAGRLAGAHSSIDNAAANAARAASIARDPGQARSDAIAAAKTTLNGGTACPSPTVSVDTSGFGTPAGTVGVVRVQVTCVVPMSDLTGLPTGGARTVTADAESVIDTYRVRGNGSIIPEVVS